MDERKAATYDTVLKAVTALLETVRCLRDPKQGCPWDIRQDMQSISNYTLQEAYELVDAVERQEVSEILDELGDLLFHVALYARIAEERGSFDFAAVATHANAKFRRRHPHVFADARVENATELRHLWERIKTRERVEKGGEGLLLDDVGNGLPALQRAQKLQCRAAMVGFDWPDADAVVAKVEEEMRELREALSRRQEAPEAVAEEAGDVLFSLINLLRHCGHDGEQVLRATNRKFCSRFNHIERVLRERGESLDEAVLEDMETLWQQAKRMRP